MRVAILILAHKNLEQLELLISSLHTDFDIYVHVDKKWNIPIDNLNKKYNNVYFFSEYAAAWGSSYIMLATISLLRISGKKSYDYYIFISGQDLPLKTNETIFKTLEGLNGASLIKYQQMPRKAWALNGGFDRIHYYWEYDMNSAPAKFAMKVIRKFQRIFKLKRKLFPMPAYYGHSMWFALHSDALKYVLDFLDKNPDYVKSMRYTTLIDEVWLGTIVINSPVKVLDKQSSFVNWTTGPEYPRTLRMEDFEGVLAQDCMFARKFDINVDKEVIYKILNNRQ